MKVSRRMAEIVYNEIQGSVAALREIMSGVLDDESVKTAAFRFHALKGALANMGETELSAFAGRLELAGKQKNGGMIAAEAPVFIDELTAFAEMFAPDNNEDGAEEHFGHLTERLKIVEDSCAVYDKKTAKDIIAGLRIKKWPTQVREHLAAMDEHLLLGDFDEVIRAAVHIRTIVPEAEPLAE